MTSAILYTRDAEQSKYRQVNTNTAIRATLFLSSSMQLTAALSLLSAQLGQYLLSTSIAVSHSTSRRCERIVPSHCRSGCTCVAPPSFSSCSSSEDRGGDRASRRGRGQSHPAGAATHPQASVSVPQRKNKNNQKPQIPGQDLDPLINIKILIKKHEKKSLKLYKYIY